MYMMSKIAANDFIWDASNPKYKATLKKKLFFEDLSSKIQQRFKSFFTGKDLQAKFSSMASYYRTLKQKISKSGNSTQDVEDLAGWEYYTVMNFLDITTVPTPSICNYGSESKEATLLIPRQPLQPKDVNVSFPQFHSKKENVLSLKENCDSKPGSSKLSSFHKLDLVKKKMKPTTNMQENLLSSYNETNEILKDMVSASARKDKLKYESYVMAIAETMEDLPEEIVITLQDEINCAVSKAKRQK